MSRIYVYRNGYLEVVGTKDCYKMRYYRDEKNILVRNYKGSYFSSLTKFKKVIDTEGF